MDKCESERKIFWVVTGAGHFLRECADIISRVGGEAEIYLTRAAIEVCNYYRVTAALEASGARVIREGSASSMPIIQMGRRCRALVIAPATSNTVAKCALGIADSLASTFFSQADKGGIRSIFLPTDAEREAISVTPSGREIKITARDVDLRRAEELAAFPNVTVARSPEALEEAIRTIA